MKKSNPGIAFTEVGRVLGERWNKLSGWLFLWHSGIYLICFIILFSRAVDLMLMFVAVCFVFSFSSIILLAHLLC